MERRMGFGTGVSQSQPPRSTGTWRHTASGSLAGRQVGGMALETPCPWLLCSGSQRGQDPPALPATPPKCCLDGVPAGSCRGDAAQPQERGCLGGGSPSLTKVPSEGEEAPTLYWCELGSQPGPALQLWRSLGKGGDPLWLLQGPQIPAGQAGIWGCWRWVWKVQELGSRI